MRIGFPARLDCKVNTNGFVRWSVGATKIMLPSPGCNCIVLGNSSLYFNETTHATGGDYTCAIFGGPFGEINGSITIAGKNVIYTYIRYLARQKLSIHFITYS